MNRYTPNRQTKKQYDVIQNFLFFSEFIPRLLELVACHFFQVQQFIVMRQVTPQSFRAKENVNSKSSFGQATLTFFWPQAGATAWSSQFMIQLEDNLLGTLPVVQVSFKSYLPSKKIDLSQITGRGIILKPWEYSCKNSNFYWLSGVIKM